MLYSAFISRHFILFFFLILCSWACSSPEEEPQEQAAPPVTGDYLYRKPPQKSDGWEIASLKQENMAEELVNRIEGDPSLGISGVLLSQGGKLVLEEYTDPLLADSLLPIGENRLLMIATLTAIFEAEADGLQQHMVSLSSSVYAGRQTVPDTSVALQQLLKMRADLLCRPQQQTFQDVASKAHGDDYYYCPANYLAVMQWLEAKTNEPLSFFAEGNLFEPLVIDRYRWDGDEIELIPRDMLKLAALYAQQGRWQGNEIFQDKWVLRLQEKAYDENAQGRFRYGWWQHRLLSEGRQYALFYSKGEHYLLVFVPDLNGGLLLIGNFDKPVTEYFNLIAEQVIPALKPE